MRIKKTVINPKSLLMVAIAIIFLSIANAQTTPRVMIIDFDTGRYVTQRETATATVATILAAYLREEFEVVSPAEIDRIINEQGFHRETLTDRQMEIVDSLLNLSIIITGSINMRFGDYFILASALDATSNEILTTVGEAGLGREPIRRVAPRVAQSLMAEINRSEEPVPQYVDVEDLLVFSARQRGVLINGVRWATSNVDMRTGRFTASPEIVGRFNQWGSPMQWISSPPVNRGAPPLMMSSFWSMAYNPCPPGWRVPYRDELESLIAAGSFWTTVNGVPGRVFGTPPNQIFLPAAGCGGCDIDMDHITTHVAFERMLGFYWSRDARGTRAYRLRISQVDATVGNDGHFCNTLFGFSVRCVQADNRVWIEF